MFTKRRKRFAIPALLSAAIALVLALPGAASAAEPAGTFTKYFTLGPIPTAIAAGPDGNLWFPGMGLRSLSQITPEEGAVTSFTEGFESSLLTDSGITAGPDGNLWLTEAAEGNEGIFAIDRSTTSGTITKFTTGLKGGTMNSITAGPDGNLWFTTKAGNDKQQIAFTGFASGDTFTLTFNGETTAAITFSTKAATLRGNIIAALEAKFGAGFTASGTATLGVTVDFGGAFASADQTLMSCAKVTGSGSCTVASRADGGPASIGRITTSGIVTQFTSGLNSGAQPASIAAGADGNLWFADQGTTKAIGRITTSGTITMFTSGLNEGSVPRAVAAGPDGNVWFTDPGSTKAIGRITPSGTITEFSAGLKVGQIPTAIAGGPDGNVWFTLNCEGACSVVAVGRIKPSGTITTYREGYGAASNGAGIALGPDGNMWVADSSESRIWKVGTEPQPELTAKIEAGSGTVVSNPAGIECSGAAVKSCSEEFAKEAKVTLTASPAAGYLFKGWKKCDAKVEYETGKFTGVNGRQCTVNMSAAKTVGASFVPAYSLTGSKASGSGPGSLSTAPGGLSCATNCSNSTALYKAGTLTVNAKPGKHFHLVEFKGGSGSAEGCDEETTCSFTIAANSSIEALFAEDAKFDLSLEKEGGGQGSVTTKPAGIACGYTCTAAVASYYTGEVVSISVAFNKGTESVTWTTSAGTCTGSATSCSVTMGEAHELVAKFE